MSDDPRASTSEDDSASDRDPPEHAARSRPSDEVLGRSLALVRFLRDGCPWDARQTPESLRPYLLEEAHETADAVLAGDDEELAGELGDLLLNVAFQIVLAEERDAFGAAEVVRRLEAKMEARHPHVYGDAEEPPDWEETKARERAEASDAPPGHTGPSAGGEPEPAPDPKSGGEEHFTGVPSGLEPLSRAHRVQQRAAALGFEWPSADGALAKLREEVEELEATLGETKAPTGEGKRRGEKAGSSGPAQRPEDPSGAGGTVPDPQLEREIGDVLLAAVSVARLASVHPARALERATQTFERRFRALVRRADQQGLDLEAASLEELAALWHDVKGEERGGPAEEA